MDRFQPLDVSNSSLGAHLFPSEEVYLLTPGVGLYSGASKSLPHSSGTVYLTSHRLFYIDDAEPHRYSCFVRLSIIRETQYYAGFLKSSPKVTVGFRKADDAVEHPHGQRTPTATGLSSPSRPLSSRSTPHDWRVNAPAADASAATLPTRSWVCRVCAFSNTLELGTSADSSVKCSLCGVASDVNDLAISQTQSAVAKPVDRDAISETVKKGVPSDGLSCPVCTFHNHPSMLRCEMCDSALVTAKLDGQSPSPRKAPEADADPSPRPVETADHVRLSFRKGGDKSFYDTLKTTLKEKRWNRGSSTPRPTPTSQGASTPSNRHRYRGGAGSNIDGRAAGAAASDEEESRQGWNKSRGVGIEGILSAVDLQSRVENDDMQDALRDLEALMTRAKKMVDLAESLNAKLTRSEVVRQSADGATIVESEDQEAANMIRTSMMRLGLPTPAITPDMARDEFEYNTQLARELGGLLYAARRPLIGRGKVLAVPAKEAERSTQNLAGVEQDREGCGILALDEVWCLWNRARGVALVSPKVLLNVLPLLSTLTVPTIACKTLSSGLKVIHTPRYATVNLNRRIRNLLDAKALEQQVLASGRGEDDQADTPAVPVVPAGITTLEIATIEACPVSLMAELLNDIEADLGALVQDHHAGQVTWYRNIFTVEH